MSLSVTHRILGPIALLIVIGASATAWISHEAVRTHDELQSQEELAYEILFSVERAQKAFHSLDAFAEDVLNFNMVVAPDTLRARYQSLRDALRVEIAMIRSVANAPEIASSVANFADATRAWEQEAETALGLRQDSAIPSRQRLDQLSHRSENALQAIYGAAKSGAALKSGRKRQEYEGRVDAIFYSMLAIFAIFGVFFSDLWTASCPVLETCGFVDGPHPEGRIRPGTRA